MWNEKCAAECMSCCTTGRGAEIGKYSCVLSCKAAPARERALRCRQAEWSCPDPTLTVDNSSNGVLWQRCLWGENGVAGAQGDILPRKGDLAES